MKLNLYWNLGFMMKVRLLLANLFSFLSVMTYILSPKKKLCKYIHKFKEDVK